MKILNTMKAIVYKADLMNTSSLLRVNGEAQHTTLIGGLISISIMVLLIASFSNKIIDTLNKMVISSTSSTINIDDPQSFSFSTSEDSPFMLGIEVWGHNLNDKTKRYFDVKAINTVSNFGKTQNTTR